jgi:ATP-dependent Lon protease
MHIARRFLLPKQLKANGLNEDHFAITEPALLHIATRYTREAGVRSLERAIGAVVRYKAVEWSDSVDAFNDHQPEPSSSSNPSPEQGGPIVVSGGRKREYKRVVEEHELEKVLGIARWDGDEKEREERRGVVYGLVVMGQGEGGILPVETIAVPGTGKLKLTGSLGDVIKESGELALSWLKMHAYDLCITDTRMQDPLKVPEAFDVHLHLPAGAQKKDGPSAGVAMVCAFVSLLTGACVSPSVAMTGEVRVLPFFVRCFGIDSRVCVCVDFAEGICYACGWDQGESAGCTQGADDQSDFALGKPEGCGTRCGAGDSKRDAVCVCDDGEGGFRCCVWQEQVGVEERSCVVGECEAIVGGMFFFGFSMAILAIYT